MSLESDAQQQEWGTFGAGNGQFKQPVAIDLVSAGNVYMTDLGNARVQKFRPTAPTRKPRSWHSPPA